MSLATSHFWFSCPFINLEVERIRHDSAGVLQYQHFSRQGKRQKPGKGEGGGGHCPTATAHTTTRSSAPLALPSGEEHKHSWRGLRKGADSEAGSQPPGALPSSSSHSSHFPPAAALSSHTAALRGWRRQ